MRHTARFVSLLPQVIKIESIIGTSVNYDTNVRIINNRCEDTGGSCGYEGCYEWLRENSFIRSGAMVEPELSVNRGSGAWFFSSKNIVAQKIFLMALGVIMILQGSTLIMVMRMYLFSITSH